MSSWLSKNLIILFGNLSFLTKGQEATAKSLLFTVFTHWAQYVPCKYLLKERMDGWMEGWQAGR